jgi:thioredoxin 1
MLMNTPYITLMEDNFQSEVLEAKTLVLVDCWASWCGSFHQINPILHQLAMEFAGHIQVGRLDVAVAEKLATHYGIRAVPTLLLFQDGQVRERLIGCVSKPAFASKLNALLPSFYTSRSRIACL